MTKKSLYCLASTVTVKHGLPIANEIGVWIIHNTHLCCVATCVTRSEFCAIAHPPVRGILSRVCARSGTVRARYTVPYRVPVRAVRVYGSRDPFC